MAIQFKDVSLNNPHKEHTYILHNVSASVPKGKVVTIVGPSGSGKSTLLSLCNLLITPDAGEVLVYSTEVRKWNVQKLRRQVGLAFQTAAMLPGTILYNLTLSSCLHKTDQGNPEEMMDYVGLPRELLDREAEDLSGGQKQRLSLARMLVTNPSIMLLDEITSALDLSAAKEIEKLIMKIHQDSGNTILWVTHDLAQAQRVGDYTWLIADGQLVESAETDQFFHQPEHEETQLFLKGEWQGRTS